MEKIEANLTQYNARLLDLRGKAAEVQADMKLEYLSQVENLEKKRDELKDKHNQLQRASEHAWEDVKAGTEKAWNELKDWYITSHAA
jgi:Skp family chaperone for outer membrane proteins